MYAQAGRYDQAARVAREGGELQPAIGYLLEGKHHLEAGDLLASISQHKEAVQQYELAKAWDRAAQECLTLGLNERAARYFEKAGALAKAGGCFEKSGELDEAIRVYEREARRLAQKHRMEGDEPSKEQKKQIDLRLAKLLERLGRGAEAASKYSEWGADSRAGELLQAAGQHRAALDRFLEAEDWVRALPLLDEVPDVDPREKARIYRACRRYEDAARIHSELGEDADAAECYEAAGRWVEAAGHWEKAGEILRGGELYFRAGEWRPAARCFSTAGRYEEAAQAFRKIPDPRSAAACLLELNRYLEAARLFLQADRAADAAHALQKIEAESPDFARATILLVPLLLDEGHSESALHRLRLLPTQATDTGSLAVERHYWEGRALEAQGDSTGARKAYQRTLALDRAFRDVGERLGRLESAPSVPEGRPLGVDTAPMQALDGKEQTRELGVGDTLLGRYRLEAELGKGGMGRVYRAHDRELEETVALKTLLSSSGFGSTDQERLLREVQIARRITHANVVRVFDLGRFPGGIFVTMEYLDGRTLDLVLREDGPFSLERLRGVLRQLLLGLEPAHRQRVVHRDLKPSNVHLDAQDHVKILDFGIARDEGSEVDLTIQGEVLGSPKYMSPEQIRGDALDGRSDLYSLGIVAYTLLSGREPFRGKTPSAIAVQQLRDEPPDLRTARSDVPDPWLALLGRLLAKDRDDRFPSVREALSALEALPAVAPVARPETP
jgi:tetratricopeptide (TPR) repeat protein